MNRIKAIIFDLDGVLVDTKMLHFNSLNKSLKKNNINYTISYSDHLKTFDGLPTSEKLKILLKKNKINKKQIKNITRIKNIETQKGLKKIKFNKKIYAVFSSLSKKYKLAIATNAVKSTLDTCILNLKLKKFLSFQISNKEIIYPKPHPEIYLRCFLSLRIKPSEAIIIEDSHYGRQAALQSGGNLLPIKKKSELNIKIINSYIKSIAQNLVFFIKKDNWIDNSLNVLVPMAGAGKRFQDAGYIFPKPLIEINNKPMIQYVVNNLNIKANYIFIVQKEHASSFGLNNILKILVPNCNIIVVDKLTEGAACTTLLAKNLINNKKPLLIANSDQYVEWDSSEAMYHFTSKNNDGAILTFNSIHPKWSYVRTEVNSNIVLEVAEKKVISNQATAGIYYWKHGSDYVKYAEKMISKNIRFNNEFYVCPVYNEAILEKKIITTYPVKKMWGLGTPHDLEYFIKKFKYL
jgi:beta-phosphoglucomutase-like phosphatase (HAD superfamily)/dTDP-glucose pyrophosphorylase